MEKIFIKNRKGQKIAVVVEKPDFPSPAFQASSPARGEENNEKNAKGLAFVMHGLGGFKEQLHIRVIAEAFLENGYTTVSFDTTNSIGESEGKYEDATTTNYYADLEDVIKLSESQSWYQEPFVLAGHSLGGFSVVYFSENYPSKVKAVAPVSAMISGKLSIETKKYSERLDEWKKTGWLETESVSKPGFIKRLPWSHIEDRFKYDLLSDANRLTMPVLLIVDSEDDACPVEYQKMLFNALTDKKEFQIIQGAPHTFRAPEHLRELKEIFDKWIKSLN